MVFEQNIGDSLMFALTNSESDRVQYASFIAKDKILKSINHMSFMGRCKKLMRVKNIICVNHMFKKQEEIYIFPKDKDRFASDMMDLSMAGYAILWIGTDTIDFNEMVVTKTSNIATNIDSDVIGAFLDKIEGEIEET